MNIIRLRTAVRICSTQLNRLMPINIYYFKYFFFKKDKFLVGITGIKDV